MQKHKEILEDMKEKGLLTTIREPWDNKTIVKYKVTPKGLDFYKLVLDPMNICSPDMKAIIRWLMRIKVSLELWMGL